MPLLTLRAFVAYKMVNTYLETSELLYLEYRFAGAGTWTLAENGALKVLTMWSWGRSCEK